MFKVKTTYKCFAFMMAFWMSFMSLGVQVDMHFCGGELKSSNFFGEAEKCDMHKGNDSKCTKHAKSDNHKCCHHKRKAKCRTHQCCHKKEVKEETGEPSIGSKGCCHNKQFKFELDEDFVKDDAFVLNLFNYNAIADCLPILLSYSVYNENASVLIPEIIPPQPLPEIDVLANVQCYRI